MVDIGWASTLLRGGRSWTVNKYKKLEALTGEKKNQTDLKDQTRRFTGWWASGGRQHCFVVAGAEWWWPEKAEEKKFGEESERGKLKMICTAYTFGFFLFVFFVIKGD